MQSNLDKYKLDLKSLIQRGDDLYIFMQYECFPDKVEALLKKQKKFSNFKDNLLSFTEEYQLWYSEAQAIIKQLLPDRLDDFIKLYESSKVRKEISFANYTIADYLQGLRVTRGLNEEEMVGPSAAIPRFVQQLSILKSVQKRFESSLFDIKQLVQADLFDSELDAARELLKNKFIRAAGAMAGVVLEKHLSQVCSSHKLKVSKKNPNISDLNTVLKNKEVITTPKWRFIQHLSDLRNLCDHNKEKEPTLEEVSDLINGVDKTTKTLF